MPYDANDPRSALATASNGTGVPRPAHAVEFAKAPPDETSAGGSQTWSVRSQSAVVSYTKARAGDELCVHTSSESTVFLPYEGNASIRVTGSDDTHNTVPGPALVFVPPGKLTVSLESEGVIVRMFAAALEPGLTSQCSNRRHYEVADVNVAPFVAWPEGDQHMKVYRFNDVAPAPGRFGRIYRCSTMMVNVIPPEFGPRNPQKFSPHFHDDFEQLSLQLEGDYVHHLRCPWTPDSTTWRDDEHLHCESPALVVIPPPLVHTSAGVGDTNHWLVDIFAPPRADFSARNGWVLNADDYPMPSSP